MKIINRDSEIELEVRSLSSFRKLLTKLLDRAAVADKKKKNQKEKLIMLQFIARTRESDGWTRKSFIQLKQ